MRISDWSSDVCSSDLIALAAEKAPADPEVLIGCYMLSTQQGLENADHVHQWFAMAANLSGDDGPVQSADIEQLIDQAPDWDKRVSEAWYKLKAGRSEEHTSECQSLMPISYAGFCLTKIMHRH